MTRLISALDQRAAISGPEVAALLGISRWTVQRYAKDGSIPGAFRVRGRGHWKFRREVIEEWWAKECGRGVRRGYKVMHSGRGKQ
jgi:excisionase family DNA binding protein